MLTALSELAGSAPIVQHSSFPTSWMMVMCSGRGVLDDVGVAELVALDVGVEDDVLVLEDALVDIDGVELVVLGDDVHGLVDADVVDDVDVFEEVLGDVGPLLV
eukprot:6460086-Amphidinium_carterae.3